MTAKSLMILGTSSGVGKSVITAGFCRLFSDLGYKVAPFKAQNMSNNSYVTDGGEIGRAQAVQAECARINPTVDMNPVLLKPAADNRSQVIVHGKSIGHFNARDYYAQKGFIGNVVQESYDRLASNYEITVLEGAGSPAEINLKKHDIVNMRMAKMAQASCLLVGDIDRGGVFAALVGTLEILDSEERERIVGFIINKFRGDKTLLEDGISWLEKRTGKRVLGVLPYDHKLRIQEEDALDIRQGQQKGADDLDIAVILLPRISNFTDFDPLVVEPGVNLRYVREASELGFPDLMILPGTKATISDLQYLRDQGFEKVIRNYVSSGGRLLGICGGFQMLGEKIIDCELEESNDPEAQGFGFFSLATEFKAEKVLKQVNAALNLHLFGQNISGNVRAYEIHMGRTSYRESYSPFGEGGAIHLSERIAGTYYHGLFDSDGFRQNFLSALAMSVGKKRADNIETKFDKEKNYNRLARLLTENIDMEFVRKCLNLPLPLASIS